jgi:hypothetical protein
MSLFFFSLDCLRELSQHESLNNSWPRPSIADLTNALDGLCSRSWQGDLEHKLHDSHAYTRAEVLPDRCFESVYMVTILRDGFGFDLESRDITFTFLVDKNEVEWSLGMAISHFAEENLPDVTHVPDVVPKSEIIIQDHDADANESQIEQLVGGHMARDVLLEDVLGEAASSTLSTSLNPMNLVHWAMARYPST